METLVKITILAIALIIPLISFVVWNTDKLDVKQTHDQEITVLVSFSPLFDFTKAVGGDKINVELLVRDSIEPHNWDPSIRDIENMQKAEMIVVNGAGFENWIDKFSEINIDTIIVDTSTGISVSTNNTNKEEHVLKDPHIWLNPVLVKTQVQNISDALQKLDPDNAVYYQSNADIYLNRLDALDDTIRDELSSCKKDFITYHNAFSYFADEYGLHQHAIITSTDPHAELAPRTFQDIIELAKDLDISIIFTEQGTDQRILQVVSQEIDGDILTLSTIETSEEDSDYIQRMEANLSNLKEALC